MKKSFLPIVCVLILSLSSCFNKGEKIEYYTSVPAIVAIDYETFQPIIKTQFGTCFAPSLQNALLTDLWEGSAILTSFNINYDQQPSAKYYTVSEMVWNKVDVGYPSATVGGESQTGDFNAFIENLIIYSVVENVVFFVFQHTANNDKVVTYEATYNSDGAVQIPVLYLRAKKSSSGSSGTGNYEILYAFNMRNFFYEYKNSDNIVKFKIMYKIGEDSEGKDQYREYVDQYYNSVIQVKME